jgi:predicted nucleotidyltransferase
MGPDPTRFIPRGASMTGNTPELAPILDELSASLRKIYGERFVRLMLYGSHARGDAHTESDLDLLLILRDTALSPTREIDRIADVLADFNLRHDVLISILPVTEDTLQQAEGPFWNNVRRDGIAA